MDVNEETLVGLERQLDVARKALWQTCLAVHEAGWDKDPEEKLCYALRRDTKHAVKLCEEALREIGYP